MNITGAIFDFDGTVFDSMHIWKGVKFQFFDRIGLVLNEEEKKEFQGLFLLDAIELAKERFDLGLSEGTVKLHITAILKILNVYNRTGAVAQATTLGILNNHD